MIDKKDLLSDDEALAAFEKMTGFRLDDGAAEEPASVVVRPRLVKPFACMDCGRHFDYSDVSKLVRRERNLMKNCPHCKSERIIRNVEHAKADCRGKYEPDAASQITGPSEGRRWKR